MKKFIRILEEHGVNESLLKLAPFALANYRKDSYEQLGRLCKGEKKLMAAVIAGVIVLWLIKKFHKRCQTDLKKNERRDSFRELNQYLDSIQLVARLDTSIDQQALRAKAVGFLLDRQQRKQALSSDLNESKLEHKKMLGQIMEALRGGTNHSQNAIHQYLSDFLNSISFTTLGGKPFTPQNINRWPNPTIPK
jgi:hypothetical protein